MKMKKAILFTGILGLIGLLLGRPVAATETRVISESDKVGNIFLVGEEPIVRLGFSSPSATVAGVQVFSWYDFRNGC